MADIATNPLLGKGVTRALDEKPLGDGVMRVFGLVLAGGAGRRMGGADKARLEVGGLSLLDRALAALAPARRLAVAGGSRIRADDASGLVVLPDSRPGLGPLAGLAAGLAWAESGGADWLLTAPVDAPFLDAATYGALLAATDADLDAVFAASEGRSHWLIAAWRPRLAAAARHALKGEDLSVARFLKDKACRALDIPDAGRQFMNVNAPADLAAANALVAKGS